jgi:hypothetical protein
MRLGLMIGLLQILRLWNLKRTLRWSHTIQMSKTHTDICYYIFRMSMIILYISNVHVYNSHEIHFRQM